MDIPNPKILDGTMGTGYPFAIYLAEKYDTYRMDLAFPLIKESKRQYGPIVKCFQGDVENLGIRNDKFDITYCVQSTWYFPRIDRALGEMFRVTRGGICPV